MKLPNQLKPPDWTQVKSAEASQLRQRKHELIRQFTIPDGLLPGTICVRYRKCGNENCRCASDAGHESWVWTFMRNGKKYVEHVPNDQVEEVRRRVEEGRVFQDAVREVLATNARLLVLEKGQRRAKHKR